MMLACIPVIDLPVPKVHDCTKDQCHRCIQEVWMAPSTLQKKREHPEANVICLECVQDLSEDGMNFKIPPPTEEQVEELKKALG